jgi:hypothetical protein
VALGTALALLRNRGCSKRLSEGSDLLERVTGSPHPAHHARGQLFISAGLVSKNDSCSGPKRVRFPIRKDSVASINRLFAPKP